MKTFNREQRMRTELDLVFLKQGETLPRVPHFHGSIKTQPRSAVTDDSDIKVVCQWCPTPKFLRGNPEGTRISHGICAECSEKWMQASEDFAASLVAKRLMAKLRKQ